MNREKLIAFEEEIASLFNESKIPYPVHLDSGNEDPLIDIFKGIKEHDWVCGSWRMHYKCLLHGVPPEELKAEILKGNSISLCFPERRIISSAIVGGILPIALGIALAIKRKGDSEKVWCFLGDMASNCGIFHECFKYARNFKLPIKFIIEDNGVSVLTDTKKVWGEIGCYQDIFIPPEMPRIQRFKYKSKWPHCGAGERVQF